MGLESRSGQGFSRTAVLAVITACGIVTDVSAFKYSCKFVATVITACGINKETRRNDFPLRD